MFNQYIQSAKLVKAQRVHGNTTEYARYFSDFNIYFGSEAAAGKENQWVKTIPENSWFTYVSKCGPEKSLFDEAYQLSGIEEQK